MTPPDPTIEQLAAEEAELRFSAFSEDDAWVLGSAMVAGARAAGAPVAIDIRRHGHQLFHAALPGSSPDNDRWIERKARVVDRFGHSSLYMRVLSEQDGTTLEQLYLGPGPTTLFFLAEALLEYEQQFALWRFKHVQLVERIIGPGTSGTGGTLGARYLQRTVHAKFFPVLWDVRARFFGAPRPA